jgi:hypothetical protein
MTGVPKRLASSVVTRRAVTSIGDPEDTGQITLISLLGYVCAAAAFNPPGDIAMATANGKSVVRRELIAHFQRCTPFIGFSIWMAFRISPYEARRKT